MDSFLKSLISVIISGSAGGGIVQAGGGSIKQVIASAGASAVIGLINLWLHKPGTEPSKNY